MFLRPNNKKTKDLNRFILYATSQFVVGENRLKEAIKGIETELDERLKFYESEGRLVEYQRLKQRVEFDLEMLSTTGSTKGVENYARYLTGQKPGETPYSLFDYFEIKGQDYLVIVDEITPGAAISRNASRIWNSSKIFRAEKSCSAATMTCSGMPRRQRNSTNSLQAD